MSTTTNRSKGDRDPSNWLPPDANDVCSFVSDWVAIKTRWGLSMDSSEYGRIGNLLATQCEGSQSAPSAAPSVSVEPLPPMPATPPATPPAATPPPTEPPAATPPTPTQPATTPPTSDVYYANCTAARAAGAAPLHTGDPGYRLALDRDKDGVACE